MKFLLPISAAILIALIVVWPQLNPKMGNFRLGFSALKARDTIDPSMVNPRYVGIDERRLPFSITADIAKNLMKGVGTVELEMPKADLTLKDGSWLVLTAESGVYSRERKTLELSGDVNLFHDTGYEIRTTKATIDLDRGEAKGSEPVAGHGPFGELKADGFVLKNKGETIFFTGKAKLVIFPGLGSKAR